MISEGWGNTWGDLNDTILNPYINQISIASNNTVYLQCDKVLGQLYQLFKSINPLLGINNQLSTAWVTLFPNPAHERISISNNTTSTILGFTIFNSTGQKIKSVDNRNNEIDVSNLNLGLYMIVLNFENKKVIQKIIVQ